MSIRATVRRMARQTFEVQRRGGFFDEAGRYRIRGEDSFCARGNVQPSTPEDVQRLPEASRTQEAITLFGVFRESNGEEVALRATSPDSVNGDRIVYCGTEYEVQVIARWPRHTRYVCTKAQQ